VDLDGEKAGTTKRKIDRNYTRIFHVVWGSAQCDFRFHAFFGICETDFLCHDVKLNSNISNMMSWLALRRLFGLAVLMEFCIFNYNCDSSFKTKPQSDPR
jgi:hypothetical protein